MRPQPLTTTAGVAIMALGALEKDPDCGVKIVPCGMNYFHAHKFRSRAVVEFGTPVEIPKEVVEMYKRGERREAIAWVLDTVYQALVTVTVTSPDYDTLMVSTFCVRAIQDCALTLASSSKPSAASTILRAKSFPYP